MQARCASISTIAAVAATVLVACSHAPPGGAHARAKPSVPRVVQANADHPGWAIFSPVGDAPLLAIAAGFSTHMWVLTAGARGEVRRIAFDGSFDTIDTPTTGARLTGITLGPRGDMWVAEAGAGKIGEITMPDGPIVEFPLPRPNDQPTAIAMGTDRALWYAADDGTVGKMTSSGVATEYHLPALHAPAAIAASPNGDVWVCGKAGVPGSERSRAFAARVTSSGKIAEYDLGTTGTQAVAVAVGGDGNAWVSVAARPPDAGRIVRVTPDGATTSFAAGGDPRAIAASGADRLDFALANSASFGEITTSGQVSTLPLPGGPSARANAIAVAPNGDEWFAGSLGGKTALFVRLPSKIDAAPASISLDAAGDSRKLTVKEKNYDGRWTIASSDGGIADATGGKTTGEFTIVAISTGTCTLTIADKKGNSIAVPVTVK